MKNRAIKFLLSLVIILLLGFLLVNFPYFSARAKLLFGGTTTVFKHGNFTGSPQRFPAHRVIIDAVQVDAPIVFVENQSGSNFQKALRDGVVHYPGTAKPGENGNCYIFGHSSDYVWSKGSYKTVFWRLPELKPGDAVKVTNEHGELFTYTVTESFVASASDVYLLDQGDRTKKKLTLQTSYPLGTALKRWIVVGEMQ
jgi:LPXTG-site transpeptidase (sortase) family protein